MNESSQEPATTYNSPCSDSSNPSFHIRKAFLSDLDVLCHLEEISFKANRRATRRSIRNSINSSSQRVYVAYAGTDLVGAMILFLHKKHLRVYSIAIHPKHMGSGFGTKMLDYAVEETLNMGLTTLTLEVDMHNTKLVRWYEQYGFETTKVIVDYYDKGEDALRMVLYLKDEVASRNIVVTDYETDFFKEIPGIVHIRANTYIEDNAYQRMPDIRVFNLCSSQAYQTVGYYVSLLALARNHSVYPSAASLRDFRNDLVLKSMGDEIYELIQQSLEGVKESSMVVDSIFGEADNLTYQPLIKSLNLLYGAPLIRYHFSKKSHWDLKKVSVIDLRKVGDLESLKDRAIKYFNQRRFARGAQNRYKYDLAILVDDQELKPPSDKVALNKFRLAAESMGFYVEWITKKDYRRIPEFDALFIRVTTNVNDYTYDFARYAYAEGLVVMDDPWSILRCANKLYLYEALDRAKVTMPKTWILSKKAGFEEKIKDLIYPIILKQPDSAFSLGVHKVTDQEACRTKLKTLMKKSELIIAQEYLPSTYDWRIGVLDGEAIYACKYYMAKGHWQIYDWNAEEKEGDSDTLAVEKVPKKVLRTALRAAGAIGDGLYGVDLKEINGEVYVIEVNDNPSIDSGVEDDYLKDQLYDIIMRSFYRRLENERQTIRRLSE